MISLSKKVLITFGVIYIVMSFAIAAIVNHHMKNQVIEHSSQKAQMIIDRTVAIHEYLAKELRPAVTSKLSQLGSDKDYFDPRWMSGGYISRNINTKYSASNIEGVDYGYKMFSVNARAEESEADDYERKVYEEFTSNPDKSLKEEIRIIDGKEFFVVYKRNVLFVKGCMKCHSEPAKAPQELIKYYGDQKGFHRDVGEISAILSIRIPMDKQLNVAHKRALQISTSLIALFVIMLLIQYIYIRFSITNPISSIAKKMKDVSLDNSKLGEQLPSYNHYEYNELATAFNSMSLTLKDMTEDLQQKVDDKTKELLDINASLENMVLGEIDKRLSTERKLLYQKRFADIGQMIESVAHQWRQPLNSMSLINQDLYNTVDKGGVDKDYLNEYKVITENIIMHMEETIQDFQQYFSGNKELTRFDLYDCVTAIYRITKSQLLKNNINLFLEWTVDDVENSMNMSEISKGMEKPNILIKGIESDIKQVLMNLIQNSKDEFKKIDGETCDIKKTIIIKLVQTDNTVVIYFKDNAGGIPESIIEKVFDPYFTTKSDGEGSGIGLQMSKNIINDVFSGSIVVYNEDDGAVFKVTIPVL